MSDPRVPQELADEIIESLRNDRTALKACALAHHTLLVSSQRQLFSSISLGIPSLDGRPATRATGANFKHLLECSPHLASYVRRLEINVHEGSEREGTGIQSEHDQTLTFCLSALRNLRALKLRSPPGKVDARRWNEFLYGELLQTLLEKVRQRGLVSLDLDRFPLSMASYCPQVSHLALRLPDTSLSVDPGDGTSRTSESMSMYPQSLRLDIFEPQECLRKVGRSIEWLGELDKARISLSDLKTLHIGTDVVEWQETCAGWTTLVACAATLENLSFEIYAPLSPMTSMNVSFYSPFVADNPLDWSSLKRLRVLRIRISEVVTKEQWGLGTCELLPWISALLKALTTSGEGSSHVEEVVIQVNYKFADDTCPHLLPWKEIIIQLCNRTRFTRLRRARILVASESNISSQCDAIGRQINKYVRVHNNHRMVDILTSVSHQLYDGDIKCD